MFGLGNADFAAAGDGKGGEASRSLLGYDGVWDIFLLGKGTNPLVPPADCWRGFSLWGMLLPPDSGDGVRTPRGLKLKGFGKA
jgi:hypothetical protein